MTINQSEFVVLKKISFVGVSAAAIALAVLCPSPARALNFDWTATFQDSTTSSGTLGIAESSVSPGGVYSVIAISGTFKGDVITGLSTYNSSANTLAWDFDGSAITLQTSGGFVFPRPLGGIAFTYGSGSGEAAMKYNGSSSTGAAEVFADNVIGNNFISSSSISISAVPAPLPLLGLGAATAFSRKLKQRIALRRKREEVGEAA